ncbi:MAG: heparinase II/III family protein [Chloroflexi bacterium]|nr:heparinase II/III family protein [Chloroflexota bacterium]
MATPSSLPTPTPSPPPGLTLPAEETVLAMLRPGHPRLLLLPDVLERIKRSIEQDRTAQTYRDALVRSGQRILAEPPVERILVGPRLLAMSRKALERVYTLALLFTLDGDQRWAERAVQEMRAAAAFSDWNPSHFLDVAEMSHALAIGYDWLFDALSEDDRATIKTALVEKGLRPAEQAYRQKAWWAENAFNWNNVCNGGIATAALAVADEAPVLARFLLVRAITGLPKALASYAPDGAWAEGPGYWSYATRYTVLALAALESALGTDFGLSTLPGLAETGVFRLQSTGPTGLFFNFADAGERSGDEPSLFWLARRYDNPLLAWGAREAAAGRSSAGDLLWYDSRGSKDELARVGLDAWYKGAHLAFFRSAWVDPKALYAGFKGGDNKANHSHLDLGTFVFDALGQRWALDLGPDDYDLPAYFGGRRWTYYRLRTEGHNTLTFDGQSQDPRAAAPIVAFRSASAGGFAIADLTAAYAPSGARRVRRGIALIDGRSRLLVQDEVEASRPVDVVWAMHTKAVVAANGDRAALVQGGVNLEARLMSPTGARFAVEPVAIPPPQRPAPGVRKLVVRLPEKVVTARIVVLLTPLPAGPAATVARGLPRVVPLDRWAKDGPAR